MVVTLQLSVSYLRRALTQTTKIGASYYVGYSQVVQRRPIAQLLLRAGASIHESIIDQNVNEMLAQQIL